MHTFVNRGCSKGLGTAYHYSLNEDYNGNFNVFNSLKENISSNNKGSSANIKTTIKVNDFAKFYSESGTLYA